MGSFGAGITIGLIHLLGFFGWLGLMLILVGIYIQDYNKKYLKQDKTVSEKKYRWMVKISYSFIIIGIVLIILQLLK